jgi:heme a synthase
VDFAEEGAVSGAGVLSSRSYFRAFAWWVLAYTVLVIMWGAFVRATGSGAGCGDHWPLCNGEVIPRAASTERLVEFSHRLTSGLSLIFVFFLFLWARRLYPAGHAMRFASSMGLLFIIGEALVGAVLVILQLVGGNDSSLRAIVIAGHLVNTFLLLFWLAKVVYLTNPDLGVQRPLARNLRRTFQICLIGFVATGAIGAIVALGDTLFPARSLSGALSEEFGPTAHFLVKLRVWHPLIAIVTSGYILAQCFIVPYLFRGVAGSRAGFIVGGLILLQIAGGVVNWLLLAPVPMQLIHLGLADVTWIALCFWYFSAHYKPKERSHESQFSA